MITSLFTGQCCDCKSAGASVPPASLCGRRDQDEQEPAHPVAQLRAGGAQAGGGQEETRSD